VDTFEVPWDAEPHTKAKHALYQEYFSKWFPIMMRGFRGDITYAEGFAGPGVYKDGAPGSPVIALESIVKDPSLRTLGLKARLLFVDRDARCTSLLRERLTAAAEPVPLEALSSYGITVDIETGDCVPTLERMLTNHKAWGRPMLVVLDTWGGSVPLDLVRKVGKNKNSEVLITIQPQYFSRFAGVDDIEHGDRVFGGKGWREVRKVPSKEKSRWLLQQYRETIRGAGFDYVLDFELIDTRGQALYLVFGTTHERGLEKMKEAMWDVDDVAGVGYRDPRDPNQQTLTIEFEPNTAPLRRLLRSHLGELGSNGASVMELRQFALYRTVYKMSQVKPVLDAMLDAGEIESNGAGKRLAFADRVRTRT